MQYTWYQDWGKRTIDIFLSAFGLVILAPVFLIISILISLESRGPVIFKQKRVGKKGKVFALYKFRSMIDGADKIQWRYKRMNESWKPLFKIKDDPRFTRLGKFLSRVGLDELPQLVNVIKGKMALVGPRPLPITEEEKLGKAFRQLRRAVVPGLTSSWVVDGAHSMTKKEWIRKDVDYIKTYSLLVDVEILARTLKMVICQVLRQVSESSKS